MSVKYGFFDAYRNASIPDRVYSAEDMNNILNGIISDGISSYGNMFQLTPNVSDPDAPKISNGRGRINGHWYVFDNEVYPSLINSGLSYRYFILAVRYNKNERTIKSVIIPGTNGSLNIPDVHQDDIDSSIITNGLYLIRIAPNSSYSSETTEVQSLIGNPPDEDPNPRNYTPLITFLGTTPGTDLTDYVRKSVDSYMEATLQFRTGGLVFGNYSDGISGTGSRRVRIKNVALPSEGEDPVTLEYAEDNFIVKNEDGTYHITDPIDIGASNGGINFSSSAASSNGIQGRKSPVTGAGFLKINGVRNPVEETDATTRKYVDQFITYDSSNETLCGYDDDNRPIYRKVYNVTIPGASGTRTFTLDNLNLNGVFPVNMYGVIKETSWDVQGSSFYPLPLKQTVTSSGGSINREAVPNANTSGKFDLYVTWSSSSALVARVVFEYLKPV